MVTTLRLVDGIQGEKHNGEVFACAYSPDGGFVLSAGWDGHLRLWEVSSAMHLSSLRAGPKPLSACTFTPDGKNWVAGSMEGALTAWDGHSHQLLAQTVPHTRPISCIRFSPDGKWIASTSWDRHVSLRCPSHDRDSRVFSAHEDIVNGCRFSPDGTLLLSWSHDRSLRLWDLQTNREAAVWLEHKDRVTAGDISPDGALAASGSRDGELILWDIEARAKLNESQAGAELRGCFFLLDGSSLVTLDATGLIAIYAVPELQLQTQLMVGSPIQCAALAPSGQQLAIGGEDGLVRFVAIEGYEDRPLVVTATERTRKTASRMQQFFGRSTLTNVYSFSCPACHKPIEILDRLPTAPAPCPHCRRSLRFNRKTLVAQEAPAAR
jgi:WD40 repeat protein